MKQFFLLCLLVFPFLLHAQGLYDIPKGDLVINEFLASNATIVADQNGEYDDWIELYNNTGNLLNLDSLYLSDSYANPLKWHFPVGTALGANSYLIVWADTDTLQSGLHTNYKLSAGGERLILSYSNGTVVDSISFGVQTVDISWGRYPNGTGPFMALTPTYATQNMPVGINEQSLNRFQIYPNPASEFVYINPAQSLENYEIHLYNSTGKHLSSQQIQGLFKLDLTGYSWGIYFLRITGDEGSHTMPFIVNR